MRYVLNLKSFATLLAITFLMGGCATSQKLSSDNKNKIKSTQVSQSVEAGPVFLMAPGGATVGLMFGVIGAVAGVNAAADSRTAFQEYLKNHNISIEHIVREEFQNALSASGKISIAPSSENPASTIKLSVPQYGFGVPHLASSNVVPVLQIKSEMIDSAGTVVWSASDRMLPSIASPMDSKPWAELVADPKQVEDQLRKAAFYLSKKLVQEL